MPFHCLSTAFPQPFHCLYWISHCLSTAFPLSCHRLSTAFFDFSLPIHFLQEDPPAERTGGGGLHFPRAGNNPCAVDPDEEDGNLDAAEIRSEKIRRRECGLTVPHAPGTVVMWPDTAEDDVHCSHGRTYHRLLPAELGPDGEELPAEQSEVAAELRPPALRPPALHLTG